MDIQPSLVLSYSKWYSLSSYTLMKSNSFVGISTSAHNFKVNIDILTFYCKAFHFFLSLKKGHSSDHKDCIRSHIAMGYSLLLKIWLRIFRFLYTLIIWIFHDWQPKRETALDYVYFRKLESLIKVAYVGNKWKQIKLEIHQIKTSMSNAETYRWTFAIFINSCLQC